MVSGIIGDLLQVSAPAKTLSMMQNRCAKALTAINKIGKNMVLLVKTTCCTWYNKTMLKVRGGGVTVLTRGTHGYAFVAKGAVFIPLGWRYSLRTFLRGRKRSTEKVLHIK